MNWELKTINNLCLLVTDGAHHSPKEVKNGYPMASSKDMLDNDFDFSNIKKISEIEYKKLINGNCKPLVGDILLIKDGNSYLKKIFAIKEERELVVLSSIAILRPNKEIIDPIFFQYALRNPDTKKGMENFVSGSAIPRIVLKDFKGMKIVTPPLQTQKRIASILSSYDDLIENNLKRIKLSEETAQNIYKEWFVNFRFPNYEHTPFNEETGLPEGWEKRKVSDFFEFIKGIEVGSANYENESNSETLPFLRVGDISKRDGGIYVKKYLVKDKIVERNDILISFDGSVGSVGYGLEGSYSSGLRKIISKNEIFGKGFMFSLVKSDEIQNTINSHAKGTTILHAGTSIVHLEFPCATDKVISKFNDITDPIFEQMVTLNIQNQKLKEARDILLPRLMNRTIEV